MMHDLSEGTVPDIVRKLLKKKSENKDESHHHRYINLQINDFDNGFILENLKNRLEQELHLDQVSNVYRANLKPKQLEKLELQLRYGL